MDIINEKGLHARAAAKFVEMVEHFDAAVNVSRDGMTVPGDSIMGLLMLAAAKGSAINVEASGTEAEKVADALSDLVGNYFGEGK